MNSATQVTCPRRGGGLPPDAPDGFCLRCLFREGAAARRLTLAPPARVPDRFGNYELLGELGRRAMGRVYRARQTRAERMVALKVISDRELASPDHVERFHIEAEAAASLDHPNIVSIHEVGEHDEWHFFSVRFGVMGLPESTWRNRGPAAHLRRDGP